MPSSPCSGFHKPLTLLSYHKWMKWNAITNIRLITRIIVYISFFMNHRIWHKYYILWMNVKSSKSSCVVVCCLDVLYYDFHDLSQLLYFHGHPAFVWFWQIVYDLETVKVNRISKASCKSVIIFGKYGIIYINMRRNNFTC